MRRTQWIVRADEDSEKHCQIRQERAVNRKVVFQGSTRPRYETLESVRFQQETLQISILEG